MESIGKVFPMSAIKKSMIYTAIYNKRNEVFDIDTVNKHVKKCLEGGIKNFTKVFSSINILEFLRCKNNLNEYFGCLFIKGNYAWVSKDDKGHYRYFTRSNSGITFSLDFIDLFSIYLNSNFRKTISTIDKMFGISFDDEWRFNQRKKYEANNYLINNQEVLKGYPNLYPMISKYLGILQAMNEIGNKNLIGKSLQSNNEAMFFSSTSYIKNHYDVKYSTSVVNQVINLFTVLGFIMKVNEHDIPAEYINISKDIMKVDKCRHNHTSFYMLPNMFNILEEAEKKAKILNQNKIKYYTMTHKVVEKIFGIQFANKIYVQKVYGGTSKHNTNILSLEKEKIKHYFSVSVIQDGFASKELLKKETIISDKLFNKLWIELIGKVDHMLVKPNKTMKKKHNLQTNENVIIIQGKYKIALS